jgi:anti-sigma factor RsiW
MSAPTTGSCVEMERLLAERASGPLDASEAAALARHLLGCASCRAGAGHWEELFSLVALAPPTLKEEAAMRDLPERALLAWKVREDRFKRAPVWAVGGLLAAAAVVLVLWHAPVGQGGVPRLAVVAEAVQQPQLDWTDGPTLEMDEFDATEGASDDGTLLDGLAFEGDGAFSLGDSG